MILLFRGVVVRDNVWWQIVWNTAGISGGIIDGKTIGVSTQAEKCLVLTTLGIGNNNLIQSSTVLSLLVSRRRYAPREQRIRHTMVYKWGAEIYMSLSGIWIRVESQAMK